MSRAIIIANGAESDYSYYKDKLQNGDYIICADGGARHCVNIGIVPDLWIGDFDSCNFDEFIHSHPEFKNVLRHKLNPIKDETDTHKCMLIAVEKGYKEIHIWCATGNRADHMMSNIHLLEMLFEKNIRGYIEDSKNTITLISDEIEIKKERKYLSLIPLDKSVFVENTLGLKYKLEDFLLSRSVSMGVSNEIEKDYCYIKIRNGLMIVIQSDD